MKDESTLFIPGDLQYLTEVDISVAAADPATVLDQIVQTAKELQVNGALVDAAQFRAAYSGQAAQPAAQEQPQAPTPEQPAAVITPPPEPEQPKAEYISDDDEDQFISWLRTTQTDAVKRQRALKGQTQPDQKYQTAVSTLLNLVSKLYDEYVEPGVHTTSQHLGNKRRLERAIHDISVYEPQAEPAAAPQAEPQAEPAAAAAEPTPELSPEEIAQKVRRGDELTPEEFEVLKRSQQEQPIVPDDEPEAVQPGQERVGGRFTSRWTPEQLDKVADLLDRRSKREPVEGDEQEYQRLNQEENQLLRAARRFLVKRRAGEARQEFQQTAESIIINDPILRILCEVMPTQAQPKMQVMGKNGGWLRIFPDPANTTNYLQARTDTPGGWMKSGIVQQATAQPEAPQAAAPAAAEPAAAEPAKWESGTTSAIEQAIDRARYAKPEDLESIESYLLRLQRRASSNDVIQRRRPDLLPLLQNAIDDVRDNMEQQKQVKAGQATEVGAEGFDPDAFLQELQKTASWQRTNKSGWRPWGVTKALTAMIGTNPRVIKSRETKRGTEYKVMSPKGTLYFWVPVQKFTDKLKSLGFALMQSPPIFASQEYDNVKLSPLLEEILNEQEFDATRDPRGEAPDAAFGVPPVPPEGEPEGKAQLPPPPGEEPEPGGPDPERVRKPNRVIVVQNNIWWEISWNNWLQFLAQGASGSRWNLDHWGARIPEGQPPDVSEYITGDQGSAKYYSTDPYTNVYYVQKWSPKRFRDELNYIQAMDIAGMPLVAPLPPEEEPAILSRR